MAACRAWAEWAVWIWGTKIKFKNQNSKVKNKEIYFKRDRLIKGGLFGWSDGASAEGFDPLCLSPLVRGRQDKIRLLIIFDIGVKLNQVKVIIERRR
jgi:hypothetical protein